MLFTILAIVNRVHNRIVYITLPIIQPGSQYCERWRSLTASISDRIEL